MRNLLRSAIVATSVLALTLGAATSHAQSRDFAEYAPVLESVKENALPIDQEKGVLVKEVSDGVYVITDGIYQSAFVVTNKGVVIIDAPEGYASKIRAAVSDVTDQPITMLIYSHTHKDHIGGSAAFGDIDNLKIVALDSVAHFLKEKGDPNRLVPNVTFRNKKTIRLDDKTIELAQHRNYHSDEGDLFIYVREANFLMAVDTLAPGYVPFSGFDLTSNFHEYRKVFDDILAYDFDVFVGGHLTSLGSREDVKMTEAYTTDVYETVKRIHDETDLLAVMAETAKAAGSWDNKYLLFKAFLDKVVADATAEIEARWIDKLAGVDVWTDTHVRTALIYVRWDD